MKAKRKRSMCDGRKAAWQRHAKANLLRHSGESRDNVEIEAECAFIAGWNAGAEWHRRLLKAAKGGSSK